MLGLYRGGIVAAIAFYPLFEVLWRGRRSWSEA